MNRLSAIAALCFPALAVAAMDGATSSSQDGAKPQAAAPRMTMPPPLPTSPSQPPPQRPAPPPMPVPAPLAATSAVSDPAAAVIPQAFPRGRYEASWKKNPFLLKTAPLAQAKESWATDFALTSIAKLSGIYRVGIKNKKTGESKRLAEGSDANGEFKIVSVNLKPDRKSSSVEVEKGGEKATLTYDATMMTPQPRGGVPGQSGVRPGMPVIPGQPAGNVPLPSVRTTATGGQGAMPATSGSFQRQQAAGNAPSYTGGGGGVYGGGMPGSANAPVVGSTGYQGTSRLGGVGPRTVAGGTGQNTLIPTVGGTGSGSYTGTVTSQSPGNVVINNAANQETATTTTTGTTTSSGTTTPVTRRRTLIPAPVVNQ